MALVLADASVASGQQGTLYQHLKYELHFGLAGDIWWLFDHDAEVILQPKQKFGNITAVEAEKCNCCSICLDSFNNDDEVIELQCLHIFHRTCGMEWLRRGKGCPLRCPVQEA
mmetsp:Transcript_93412/g.300743  ORF Transcript_93412/g.300743 Transcript_93412/m.300743 type:complete len:113 (-) Transcript_93412:20-358(-)